MVSGEVKYVPADGQLAELVPVRGGVEFDAAESTFDIPFEDLDRCFRRERRDHDKAGQAVGMLVDRARDVLVVWVAEGEGEDNGEVDAGTVHPP